jgi:hypothetical protein
VREGGGRGVVDLMRVSELGAPGSNSRSSRLLVIMNSRAEAWPWLGHRRERRGQVDRWRQREERSRAREAEPVPSRKNEE